MTNLAIGSNERASLDRPAWNRISGWNAYKHLHRQGRARTSGRGRRTRTHIKDGRILNFYYVK